MAERLASMDVCDLRNRSVESTTRAGKRSVLVHRLRHRGRDIKIFVDFSLTCTSMKGISTERRASLMATDVCVYAPALMTIASTPSCFASWMRSIRSPS